MNGSPVVTLVHGRVDLSALAVALGSPEPWGLQRSAAAVRT
jgi:hypothetical protein